MRYIRQSGDFKGIKVLVIGGSAGSIEVILRILQDLKKDLAIAIVIIVHRKSTSDSSLTKLFNRRSAIEVTEANEKEEILPGRIYLAPANYHLLIEQDGTFSLDYSEKVQYSRPSIDVTFESAAEIYEQSLAALLLSGANSDGAFGLLTIANTGGLTIVQSPETAEVDFMPKAAILKTVVDYIVEADYLPKFVNDLSAAQLPE
ncbi:chemotaxis protein CheB [Paradesertivirga mongoliensis]|uniref:protein-glutamate methylesterase n=1 Tax=Paradesertivirga mongoliensis TaxID=2100740 RepID=A0ABW4ZP13_9SPHI|nr:chemotaxis protein CheB [Pedobacter mongoliensis]